MKYDVFRFDGGALAYKATYEAITSDDAIRQHSRKFDTPLRELRAYPKKQGK